MVVRKAEQKAGSKEKLSELKGVEWWYQWLSQALLIKVERSVVLAWLTRVPHEITMADRPNSTSSRRATCDAITN